ncbi:MAG TPA: signal recognition particle-docking protein FtsY [Candidatus Pelethomonas intestinigallinarum]|nr:signal recognition particle-docking protein FtsY [Candidatus Pelethomonas intestinigallinarum]
MAFWNWFKGKEKKEREDEDALEELQAQESEAEADEAVAAEDVQPEEGTPGEDASQEEAEEAAREEAAVAEEAQPESAEPETPAPEPETEPEPEKKKPSFWQRLKKISLADIFSIYTISEEDSAFFEDLEEMLIMADVGVETATAAVEELRQQMVAERLSGQEAIKDCLRRILAEKLQVGDQSLNLSTKPSVILVIGVNGVGKTTSIGKLADRLRRQGKRVLLCAGDTFRAAAADQLEIWAGRAQCELIRQHEGADPSAVLFDALQAAKARHVDVVICDTAGRLHNKSHLMAELAKMKRVIDRELPEAALETLLVLDATTGQNGLIQAKQFQETTGLTGIVLTKLDGTAKGGIVIAIAQALQVPVKFVGLGEGIDDLQPFDAKSYVEALI